MARPYPSDDALTRAAVELARDYPDAQERILRGLELARAGGVADTSGEDSDAMLLTLVNGHPALYTPGAPAGGWVCTCPDFFYGASTRDLEPQDPPARFEPMNRFCKHLFALRLVADARVWEARPQRLRRPRAVQLLDVDPATLRLVA